MLKIETKEAVLDKNNQTVFEFASNIENFEKLIPADRVEGFSASNNSCSFTIKGISKIGFKISETIVNEKVVFQSEGKNPFDFKIVLNIAENGANQSKIKINFEGDANPFIAMMAEKPLTNFFNMIIDKATLHFN